MLSCIASTLALGPLDDVVVAGSVIVAFVVAVVDVAVKATESEAAAVVPHLLLRGFVTKATASSASEAMLPTSCTKGSNE